MNRHLFNLRGLRFANWIFGGCLQNDKHVERILFDINSHLFLVRTGKYNQMTLMYMIYGHLWPYFVPSCSGASCSPRMVWYHRTVCSLIIVWEGIGLNELSNQTPLREKWGRGTSRMKKSPNNTHNFTFSLRISHSWRFGAGDTYLPTGFRAATSPGANSWKTLITRFISAPKVTKVYIDVIIA